MNVQNKNRHFDGTACLNRKNLGRKSEIAAYWYKNGNESTIPIFDPGEPSCWACGTYDSTHDLKDTKLPLKEVFKIWDKQFYLERCHIIPKALGGCNCCANIVLLCKKCHKENPDTKNVEIFKRWLKNRKNFGALRYAELTKTFEEFGLKINSLDYFLMFFSEEFDDYLMANTVAVGGKINDASRLAVLLEWKCMFNEDELRIKLPKYVRDII